MLIEGEVPAASRMIKAFQRPYECGLCYAEG